MNPVPAFFKSQIQKNTPKAQQSKNFGKILKSRKNTGPGGVLSNFEGRGVAKCQSIFYDRPLQIQNDT